MQAQPLIYGPEVPRPDVTPERLIELGKKNKANPFASLTLKEAWEACRNEPKANRNHWAPAPWSSSTADQSAPCSESTSTPSSARVRASSTSRGEGWSADLRKRLKIGRWRLRKPVRPKQGSETTQHPKKWPQLSALLIQPPSKLSVDLDILQCLVFEDMTWTTWSMILNRHSKTATTARRAVARHLRDLGWSRKRIIDEAHVDIYYTPSSINPDERM